ncbi:MAG: hypothetical protein EA385_01255 [Salinarimonadaceae bacterium]|nr:MAG: hypothetical protein EA385_01255 [Salinarimonadaceae bacterium]
MDIGRLTAAELLALHAKVAEELRGRGIVRSSNNPTGDLAETLFCRAFGWTQSGNSHPSADATGEDGVLYQIKGRRIAPHNGSRQLSAMRGLPDGGFHFLAAVLFRPDYTVQRAAIIPHALVLENSRYMEHTNSWKFLLRDVAWTWPGVEDVTEQLRSVSF